MATIRPLLRFAPDDLDVVYRPLSAHSLLGLGTKERDKSGHSPMIHATKQSDLPRIPLGNRQIGVVLGG
jgi:hypothetical protein